MEIITFHKKKEISDFVSYYDLELKKNIQPKLITKKDLGYFLENYDSSKKISGLFDNDKLKSLALYEQNYFDEKDELDWYVDMRLDVQMNISNCSVIKDHRYEKDLLYLVKIESFNQNQGYGKKLLDNLKYNSNSETLILESTKTSSSFYRKNDFSTICLNLAGSPIMAWHNDNNNS